MRCAGSRTFRSALAPFGETSGGGGGGPGPMGDDTASRVGWGVVLGGHAFDLAYWKEALKRPFDPWIMETEGRLVLRSTVLDPAATSSEAYELAKGLMEHVNGALAISHHNAEA